MKSKKLSPLHTGEILREDFLVPLKMKPEELAKILMFQPKQWKIFVKKNAI